MMTLRYLASFEGVHCSAQINDAYGAFIAHTQHIPERNLYAAVLTRRQWDQIRAERWATGGLIRDGGILVPDVDFVASDGRVFLDFTECQQHELDLQIAACQGSLAHLETLPIPGEAASDSKIMVEEKTAAAKTLPPASLESRILTAIGNTTMTVKLLATFLKVTEDEIRVEVEKSTALRFSTTGKSVAADP